MFLYLFYYYKIVIMKICLFRNNYLQSIATTKELKEKLKNIGEEITDINPDLVISIGGDGTFLSAVQKFSKQLSHIRFVGVHAGHLGFYSDWLIGEMDKLVSYIKKDQGQFVNYPILKGKIFYSNRKEIDLLAVNEIVLNRVEASLAVNVFINGEFFEHFRGDGLVISTPTGSSAYNKSLGGALIDPALFSLQMTEMASINNNIYRTLGSPVIISPDSFIEIKPEIGNSRISYDNGDLPILNFKKVSFKISNKKLKIANYRKISFWQRIRKSFIGEK